MAVYFALNIFYRTILKRNENEFYRNLFEGKVTKIQGTYYTQSGLIRNDAKSH